MTRKDYVAIAETLASARDEIKRNPLHTRITAADYVIREMADMLAADNPPFDRDRFEQATGYRSE